MNTNVLIKLLQPSTHKAALDNAVATVGTAHATYKTYAAAISSVKPLLVKGAILSGGALGILLAVQAAGFIGNIPGTETVMETIGFLWILNQGRKFFNAEGRSEMNSCLSNISSGIFGEAEQIQLPVLEEQEVRGVVPVEDTVGAENTEETPPPFPFEEVSVDEVYNTSDKTLVDDSSEDSVSNAGDNSVETVENEGAVLEESTSSPIPARHRRRS